MRKIPAVRTQRVTSSQGPKKINAKKSPRCSKLSSLAGWHQRHPTPPFAASRTRFLLLSPHLPLRAKVCCGEKAFGDHTTIVDESAATLRSMFTGDASVGVSRLSPGTGERLGGTWYLSLDGEASARIDAAASAEEVTMAVQNLTAAGNVSVTESATETGYNGERSLVVTFFDWNDPNRTTAPAVVTVGDEDLTGTGAAAYLEISDGRSSTVAGSDGKLEASQLCSKAVARVSSLLSSSEIDDCVVVAGWQGGTAYAVPAFSFDANATSLETALESMDDTVLSDVWVSREEEVSASGGSVWNVTFVGNVEGRVPELQCGSDADVLQVTNASCAAIGGSFALAFGGNVTQAISFNASALEVRQHKPQVFRANI